MIYDEAVHRDSLIHSIAGSIVLISDWVPIIVAPSDPGSSSAPQR